MLISDERMFDALLREEFGFFLQKAFAELGGGREFRPNWHIDAIEHQLDRIRFGENSRLIISMPPRHLKSITVSTAWVAWMLGRDPSLRFICTSYGEGLAEKHAADCLRLIESDWYRRAFPAVRLVRGAVLNFATSMGGGRRSTSVGGAITGLGADIIVIDDPMKADEALSEARREEVVQWFYNTLSHRLDDQGRSSIVLVMQRLHEADLAGELIRKGGWHELRLSAIAEYDELVPLTRGRFHQRRAGWPLHEARQPLALLEKLRADEPFVFAAQYQQSPVSRIGSFVKDEWFGFYDEPPQTGIVVQSWDTAVKTTVRSDWSVGITARWYQGRFYILDLYRKRIPFGGLYRAVCASCRQHGVERLLIEDASSGQQLIQQLYDEAPEGVARPIEVKSTSDKIVRFEAQAGKIEAGVVVLPRSAPWLAEFINEVIGFPNARHDDQADALAQLLANPPPQFSPIVNGTPELMDEFTGVDEAADDFDSWLAGWT